ncbi:hypothetical protein HY386_02710 [Candidatus Daviesbacteria bacterium]|nr:hypothetical protein [Candidatus Daviesbacteria bacterium]
MVRLQFLYKSSFLIPLFLFLAVSIYLVMNWFRTGNLYGGAEVGFITYNTNRLAEISQFIWWNAVAPGMPVPHFIIAYPLYAVLSFLTTLGLSPMLLQALISILLLFLMGFGMYMFSLTIFKDKKGLATVAGLFYMFNPYMMVEVWHRFLYTGIFLAAFLPLLALSWKKWISLGKLELLILFLLLNFTALYMYGSLASIITVWLLLGMITVSEAIFPWQSKNYLFKVGMRFVIGLIFWVLLNYWWINSLFTTAPALLSSQHSSEENLTTLINISRKTILPYSLQWVNPYYLLFTAELGQLYRTFSYQMIPLIVSTLVLTGLIISLKSKNLLPSAVNYLVAVLLAKGAASPFTAPYIWGISSLFLLGVVRNPYEKLGIILPFFGSILFVVGLQTLVRVTSRYISSAVAWVLVVGALSLAIIIYNSPMFTGRVFGTQENNFQVAVPKYYKEADEWLGQHGSKDDTLLHLPYSGGDVVTYQWDWGYHGVDVNHVLFTHQPSLSRNLGSKDADKFLKNLAYIFYPSFLESEQILNLLKILNVRFIVLHKDEVWTDKDTYGIDANLVNPQLIEDTLNNLDFLKKEATFGRLVIYSLSENQGQKIEVVNSGQIIYPGAASSIDLLNLTGNKDIILSPLEKDIDKIDHSKIRKITVFPRALLDFKQISTSELETQVGYILRNQFPPDSIYGKLLNIKNYLYQTGIFESEQATTLLLQTTDKLLEIYKPAPKTQNQRLVLLKEYESLLGYLFKKDVKNLYAIEQFKNQFITMFQIHLLLLNNQSLTGSIKEKEMAIKIAEKLKIKLVEANLLPAFYPAEQDPLLSKNIAVFSNKLDGEYKVLIADQGFQNIYPDWIKGLNLSLNNKTVSPSSILIQDKVLILNNFELEKGEYEISYNKLLSANLLSVASFTDNKNVQILDRGVIKLIDSGNEAYIDWPIDHAGGGGTYQISFEVLSDSVNGFTVAITSDTELNESSDDFCSLHSCIHIQSTAFNQWIPNLLTLSLNPVTKNAKLRIILPARNELTGAKSSLTIRNIEVKRVLNDPIFLQRDLNPENIAVSTAVVSNVYKESPVLYRGNIEIKEPTFIFFKETFHPGWTLRLINADSVQKINDHYLGNFYGNAWYIDKIGDYQFKIEFEPQRNVTVGFLISGISFVFLLISLALLKLRSFK